MNADGKSARTLRLKETIYPFGVGGIVDIQGESFIGMDITAWPVSNCPELSCKPLQRQLNVSKLRQPPVVGDNAGEVSALPYARFPKWRFCQDCSRMSNEMTHEKGRTQNICGVCGGKMVPMRFVAVCSEGGHVQDIPWPHWAHRHAVDDSERQCKESRELVLKTEIGRGEGLASVVVRCRACGAQRSMGPLGSEKGLLQDGYKCFGLQPWEPRDISSGCESELRPIQRGSTSLYMSDVVSAIDIPDVASRASVVDLLVRENDLFKAVKGQGSGPLVDLAVLEISKETGASEEHIRALFAEGAAGPIAEIETNLRTGEWAAFDRALDGDQDVLSADFKVVPSDYPMNDGVSRALSDTIKEVGLVQRLREVRALTGFRRYKQTTPTRVDLGLYDGLGWYPAIELFGEGIFVRFDEDKLRRWEVLPDVVRRVRLLEERGQDLTDPSARMPVLTPRYLLLHTLSHLLIRRLEFQSGYSASSLSERIYAASSEKDPQAGFLIYTSAGDVQGTLGGLVRLGEAAFLGKLLLAAVEDADRCSNDPVCIASRGQGLNNMNLSACHACSLLPETSCEKRNIYLDRSLLIGVPGEVTGFFEGVLEEARSRLTFRQ